MVQTRNVKKTTGNKKRLPARVFKQKRVNLTEKKYANLPKFNKKVYKFPKVAFWPIISQN